MEKYNNLRSDRVIDAIQEYIDVNGLKAYEPLPSERKLSELWQVSRGTIRDAIARMCREGTLYMVQGKGSFVSPEKEKIDMKDMISFSGAFRSQGKTPGSRVISQTIEPAGKEAAEALQISEGDNVHVLTRIREVDGEELLLETSHIAEAKCRGLEKFQFEKASLYNVLEIHYGIYMSNQDITVRLSKATKEEARHLDIEPGDQVFVEKAIAYSGDEVMEYTKTIVDAKRVSYTISIDDQPAVTA